MYGNSHSGLGALLLLLVALLHKMLSTLHQWQTQHAHGFWFHGKYHHWKTRHGLMQAIGHVRHEIASVKHRLK